MVGEGRVGGGRGVSRSWAPRVDAACEAIRQLTEFILTRRAAAFAGLLFNNNNPPDQIILIPWIKQTQQSNPRHYTRPNHKP